MNNTRLPSHIALRLAERGIDENKIIRYVRGDMETDLSPSDKVYAFDAEHFYILTGLERVEKTGDAKQLSALFDVSGFETLENAALGKISVDQMIATSRLVSEKDGALTELAAFSLGRSGAFEIFAKHFNLHMNADPEEDEGPIGEEPELFCPKCMTRYPEPARKICPRCMNRSSLTLRLLKLFKRYTPQVIVIMLFLILSTLLATVAPYFSTALIYDKVLVDKELYVSGQADTVVFGIDVFGEVLLVLVGIFIIRLLSTLLNILRARYIAGTVPKVIYNMKLMIFEAMQRLSVSFYTSKQTGSLMTRVNNDANNVYSFFIHGIPYLFSSVFTFTGVLISMFLINWRLTLIVLISIPVIVIGYVLIMRVVWRMYHSTWVNSSRMNSLLSDALYGQRIIKAFTQEDSESGRFASYSQRVNASHTKLAVTQTTAYPLVGLVMRIAHSLLLGAGAILVIRREMSYGLLILLSTYLNMLFEPLSFFTNLSNWWSSCVDSAQRIFEVIDAKSDLPESENPLPPGEIRGDFEARGVMFEYEPGRPVVRNLTLSIKSGQMLGIVGKTGSGKSTLVNLLARLYDPSEGHIFLDGHDIKEYSTQELRKSIGIVSQDIYLFIGSIADNIRYARPEASYEEVILAAKAACAHEYIIKLPDGYETKVGAGGQGLSGGERQRLSIARAIIQNPSILILDEATAAMDTDTERRIQESLADLQQGRTTIAIAHRLSTLRDADMLAVIEKGRVVEFGTHDELIHIEDGTYNRLYTLQMEALKAIVLK